MATKVSGEEERLAGFVNNYLTAINDKLSTENFVVDWENTLARPTIKRKSGKFSRAILPKQKLSFSAVYVGARGKAIAVFKQIGIIDVTIQQIEMELSASFEIAGMYEIWVANFESKFDSKVKAKIEEEMLVAQNFYDNNPAWGAW